MVEVSTGPGSEKDLGCFFDARGRTGGKTMEHKPTSTMGTEGNQALGLVFVHVPSMEINLARDASNTCCEAGLK